MTMVSFKSRGDMGDFYKNSQTGVCNLASFWLPVHRPVQMSIVERVQQFTRLTFPDVNINQLQNLLATPGWVFNFYFKLSD